MIKRVYWILPSPIIPHTAELPLYEEMVLGEKSGFKINKLGNCFTKCALIDSPCDFTVSLGLISGFKA